MIFNFKAYFKDVNPDGQGTAVLEFYLEHPQTEMRDQVMAHIMKFLQDGPEEETEEKASVLGFHADEDEKEEVEEWDGEVTDKPKKKV